MEPSWIIAGTSVAGFLFGTVFSMYKFIIKVRADKAEQQQRLREAAEAQAAEALRIAREETQLERGRYTDVLLAQIKEITEDRDNEERAREILQQKYEELLRGSRRDRT